MSLCKECRRDAPYGDNDLNPWVHCHHDEPGPKAPPPQKICSWCSCPEGLDKSRHYWIRIGGTSTLYRYCPECGIGLEG